MRDSGPYGRMMIYHDLERTSTDKRERTYDSPLPDLTFQEKALQKPRNLDFVAQTVKI